MAGYTVALLARRTQKLKEVQKTLTGTGHLILSADLTNPDEIQRAVEQMRAAFGSLDLLVNNAGVGYRAKLEALEAPTLNRVFQTNVLAPLLISKAALPLLSKGRNPVIVNVSSVVGRRGVPGQAAYSASKAALCSIGESLRIELAPKGIAVCTLCPALTATGFFDAQPNPASLDHPELHGADPAELVADEILSLAERPRPEKTLRWKWKLLGALTPFAPRLSDRLLIKRLGGGWITPRR